MSVENHFHGEILGLTVRLDTIYECWAIMLLILLFALLTRLQLRSRQIGPFQFVLESIHGIWEDHLKQQVSWRHRIFLPLILSVFIFVLIAYWFGLLPWKVMASYEWWPHNEYGHPWEGASPVADFNITFALAVIAMSTCMLTGIGVGGLNYLLGYLPLGFEGGRFKFSFMFILEWLDLFTRPLSLALRLLANTFAGEVLMLAFMNLCPLILPIAVEIFEFVIGVLQAFVFAMLTTIYIGITVNHAKHLAHAHHVHKH